MSISFRRTLLGVTAALILVAAGPGTLAATPSLVRAGAGVAAAPYTSRPQVVGHHGGHGHGTHPLLNAAATYLGLAPAELRSQLEAGRSLAQVSTQKGKPLQGLKRALRATVKARLDRAVAEGELSQTEAQAHLEKSEERIEQLVQRTWPGKPRPGAPAR